MKAEYVDGTYVLTITLDNDYVVSTTAIEMTGMEVEYSNDILREALADLDVVFELRTNDGWAIVPARSVRWINRIKVD